MNFFKSKMLSFGLILLSMFLFSGCDQFKDIKLIEKISTETSETLNEIQINTEPESETTADTEEIITTTTTKYIDDDFYSTLVDISETDSSKPSSHKIEESTIDSSPSSSTKSQTTPLGSDKKYIDESGTEYILESKSREIIFNERTPLYLFYGGEIEMYAKIDSEGILKGINSDKNLYLIEYRGELLVGENVNYDYVSEEGTSVTEYTPPEETTTAITSSGLSFFETDSPNSTTDLIETTTTVPVSSETTTQTTTVQTTTQTTRQTTQTTTQATTVQTTTAQTTTAPPITTSAKVKGGVDFPDDVSKTSIVFGITFYNMDTWIVTVNDVDISSGPDYPGTDSGYIKIKSVPVNTELQCIGISVNGWLRIKTEEGKIGFIYNEDAIEM